MASNKFKRDKFSRNASDERKTSRSEDANVKRRARFRDKSSDSKTDRRGRDRDNSKSDSRAASSTDRLSGLNDFSWYNQYPALLNTAASIPFPYRPGLTFPVTSGNFKVTGASEGLIADGGFKIPGVLGIHWYPSVGYSTQPTDPASIVGKEIYARVRKVYSGSIDADAPDFVMYLMALDSLFAYLGTLKRIYRCLNSYSTDNFDTPDILLNALGISNTSAENLRVNAMELNRSINELILQSRKFRCPAILDVFNRHYWLNDNVYMDANTINGQMYVFVQRGFYKLISNQVIPNSTTNTAAGLEMVASPFSVNDSDVTVSVLYQFGLSLIKALDEWDDSYMISGYLMRAYEGVPSFTVAELDISETQTPVYVEEVLSQIENSRCAMGTIIPANLWVSQNPLTNAVLSQPITSGLNGTSTFNITGGQAYPPPLLSIRSDSPTPEQVVIASRLQTYTNSGTQTQLVRPSGADASGYGLIGGTELVDRYSLHGTNSVYLAAVSDGTDIGVRLESLVMISPANTTAISDTHLTDYFYLGMFDWHPITLIATKQGGSSVEIQWCTNGDVHNCTVINPEQLLRINRVCLFSEFRSFSDT